MKKKWIQADTLDGYLNQGESSGRKETETSNDQDQDAGNATAASADAGTLVLSNQVPTNSELFLLLDTTKSQYL